MTIEQYDAESPDATLAMRTHFAQCTGPLFYTDVPRELLWSTYLGALSEAQRQHYNCNACRHFIGRYGALVTIAEDGTLRSALWDVDALREHGPAAVPTFTPVFQALDELVRSAKVRDVFVPATATLGLSETPADKAGKVWRHFSVMLGAGQPKVHASVMQTAGQVQAERAQDFVMLKRALGEFSAELVTRAHTLLTSGTLYRSEKCIGIAAWLQVLHGSVASASAANQDAVIWRAVATAPAGWCHVRSGMLGTLLDDLLAGMAIEMVAARFAEKMNPANYMRAQVAPAVGNVVQAERAIAALKSAGSLERRYATIADVQRFAWRASVSAGAAASGGGVFAHIATKPAAIAGGRLEVPRQTMTWDKFTRTVLPDATCIEAQIPRNEDRFAALVTAADMNAPPIIQWDDDSENGAHRNPVSWYYHGGVDAEMRRRLVDAGAKFEDCDIRFSLMWDNRNDLDLHVVTPYNEHIYYGTRRSTCGGELDVDRNVGGETTTPVENIRWPRGRAAPGLYKVYVQNFRFHERDARPTPFRLELEVEGQVYQFSGVASPRGETGVSSNVAVYKFDYTPGRGIHTPPAAVRTVAVAAGAARPNEWGLVPDTWVKVTGVCPSPNLWGASPAVHAGKHMFFLLEGCRDVSSGRGRGFFTEHLRGEYRPIRATLDAYAATAKIAGDDAPDIAAGLGFTDLREWGLVLRVTTATSVAEYTIDRWD